MSESEQKTPSDRPTDPCGWVKLFHRSGALVTLPVPVYDTLPGGSAYNYAGTFLAVSAALEAGFSVVQPGLEAGEEKEQVGYVLRREKLNADKSETPVIDLYSVNEAVKFKMFSVYLNNDEQIRAFEATSGLSLSNLKTFPGTAAPERGANRQSDSFITKAPKPFGVVLKANPKYNPDEQDATKKKPKRLFVRWDGIATAQPAQPNGTESTVVDQVIVGEWKKRLEANPTATVLTASLKDMNHIKCKYTWRAVWKEIEDYAGWVGFEWNAQAKQFVPPVEVPQQDDGSIPF